MSTTLATPSNTLAKVRWQEQYVSEGLNKKLNGLAPAGVIRGGKLTTAGANLSVTIEADPIFGDSIYSYIDANGHQVTFRQTGDVVLDLSAVPSTTQYIALYISYSTGAATVVNWRAYTDADLFTGPLVPEAAYVVVLGRVVVPAAGLIPAGNITPRKRRDAWLTNAPGTRDWVQLVINGSFDNAAAGQITSSDEDEPPLWDSKNITLAGLRYDIDQTFPRTGHNCLKLTGDGSNTAGSTLWNERYAAVRPGQMMRASMWVKGVGVSAGGLGPAGAGYLVLRVNFVTKDYTLISSWMACNASAMDGNFDYTELTEMLEVPATAAWAYWGIYTWDQTNTMTGAYYVDDVRLWLEAGPPQEDDIRERLLIEGEPSLRGLDIAPWGTALASYADGLAKTLRLRFDAIVSSVMEYEWKHRSGALAWDLLLKDGGIAVERAIRDLGSSLRGSAVDAAVRRIGLEGVSSVGGRFVHVMDLGAPTAGNPNAHIYFTESDSTGKTAFCVAVNQVWDGTQWVREVSGEHACLFSLKGGGTGSSISMFTMDVRDKDDADTWTYVGVVTSLIFYFQDPGLTIYGEDLVIRNVSDTDYSNPLKGDAPLVDSIYKTNVCRAWAHFLNNTLLGGIFLDDGFNVDEAACTTVGMDIQIIFHTNIDPVCDPLPPNDCYYCINANCNGSTLLVVPHTLRANGFRISAWDVTTGFQWDFSSDPCDIMFSVYSRT